MAATDDDIVQRRNDGRTAKEIAVEFGDVLTRVQKRCYVLKKSGRLHPLTKEELSRRLSRAPRSASWTDEEDQQLITLRASGISNEEISDRLQRSLDSIEARAKLFVKAGRMERRTEARPWTDEDDRALTAMRREGATQNEIAAALGRTRGAVAQRCVALDELLSREERSARIVLGNARRDGAWTKELDARVIALRKTDATNTEIAAQLDRPLATVEKHIGDLIERGLVSPREPPGIDDLVGLVVDRLTVVERAPDVERESGARVPAWWCECACGTAEAPRIVVIQHYNLLYRYSGSCGCKRAEIVAKTTEERAEIRSEMKRDRRAAGVCVACDGRSGTPTNGDRLCEPCYEKVRTLMRDRFARQKAAGRCSQCPAPRTVGIYCRAHWFVFHAASSLGDARRAHELIALWDQQSGRCAYTDEILIEGVNASVEHAIPTNRGGTNSLDNIRWVTVDMNRGKADMTYRELVGLAWIVTLWIDRTHDLPAIPFAAPGSRGRCTNCPSPATIGVYCTRCWFGRFAQRAVDAWRLGDQLRARWEEQGGRCAYTGLPLTPGGAASVDHVTPLSLGGARVIENCCWTLNAVNRVKSNRSRDAFVALCRRLVEGGRPTAADETAAIDYVERSSWNG